MPKISVLMPAYNAEKYIKEAVDSILTQTFSDFEFIIIDDGSTDRTAEIVNGYSDNRIRFCPNEKNMGVAATLNRGLGLARGEYIARMDADDISKAERFSKQVGYLDAHADVAVCGTSVEVFCDGAVIGTRFPSTEPEKLKEDLFFSCGIAHPSVMMRKATILEIGGYDTAFNGMEDYELWCRVAEKNKIAVLPEILFRYRIHRGQVTQNPSPKYKEQMRELKRRQTEQLGIVTTSEEFSAYTAYCMGIIGTSYSEIAALGRFFEKADIGNERNKVYHREFLYSDFKSVLVNLAMKLSWCEQRRLCSECSMITEKELRQRKMKTVVKNLIGRS